MRSASDFFMNPNFSSICDCQSLRDYNQLLSLIRFLIHVSVSLIQYVHALFIKIQIQHR
jgi:hypothetical protein